MSGTIGVSPSMNSGIVGKSLPTNITYRRVEMSGASTSSSSTVNLGGMTFTEPGIWLIEIHLRFMHTNMDSYHRMALSTSTSYGDVFTSWRMLNEHLDTGTNTFSNIGLNTNWLIDIPLAVTSQLIAGSFKAQSSSSNEGSNNDSNGRPYMWAMKVKDTTTAGSTVTEVKTA